MRIDRTAAERSAALWTDRGNIEAEPKKVLFAHWCRLREANMIPLVLALLMVLFGIGLAVVVIFLCHSGTATVGKIDGAKGKQAPRAGVTDPTLTTPLRRSPGHP